MTSGATVRGLGQRTLIHGSSSAGVLGSRAERSTTPSVAMMASHTRAIVISRQQSASMLISTSAAGTMDPAPLSVRLHDVIVIIFTTIARALYTLSHSVKRSLCSSLVLCLCPAEAPTHKSHYLQTNTIPMYEDDLFNQLGPATNDVTPRELDYNLPVSHKFLSLSLSVSSATPPGCVYKEKTYLRNSTTQIDPCTLV